MWSSRLPVVVLFFLFRSFVGSTNVKLENNGYKGLLIAIHPTVPESSALIQEITDAWTCASEALYKATKHRAYFNIITILVPATWTKTSYPISTEETYSKADVVIESGSISAPFTEQYGSACGEPGSKIHTRYNYYTDDDAVTNFGQRGKAIVQQWAHYRYGIYDETSTEYTKQNGEPQAPRCPESVSGLVVNVENTATTCAFDENTNTYTDDPCVFLPQENTAGVSTTLSCYQYLDNVVTFCHDQDPTNPYDPNVHNSNAKNEQNRLCDRKSSWYHILQHDDFMKGSNLANDSITDLTPSFNFVKMEEHPRYVFVIDVSNSMKGLRLQTFRTAAREMIMNYLPSGSRIGMVEFSSNADILSYLKTIETQNDREDFVNLLPTITQDFTSIGDGLLKGIEVLEYGGESAAGGNLIVLVDGKENEPKYVDMVFDSVVGKGVHVSTIYYVETDGGREKGLQQLITETGGKWVFVADENDLNFLTNAFITMVQPEDGDTTAQVLTIESYDVSIPSGAYQSSVYLDQTIGKNTVFSFSWNSGNPDLSIRLQSPDGCEFTHSSIGPTSNCGNTVSSEAKGFNTISFNISGIAKEGNWKYIIEPSLGSKVNIQISSSAADQDVEPIMITPFLTTSESSSVKVLRAKVSKGLLPIAGVNVVAKISKPDKSVVTINLLDNGAGADQKMDDGIYSKSLTDITTINGRYSVKIEAIASGTSAKINGNTMSFANYNYGVVLDDGSVKLNSNGLPDSVESNSISVTEFSRSLSMVGFTHSGASGGPDNISPCKIIDLEIKQATESTNKIDILFTAPGNDYDVGNAFYYEMFYTFEASTDLINLGQSRNETTRVVLEDDFLQGSLKSPKKFGEIETMRLALVSVPTIEGFYTVSLVVRSADLEGNVSPISNIAATEYVVGKPVVIATSTNSVFSTSIKVTTVSKPTSIPGKSEPSNGLIIGLSVSIVIIVISVVAVLLWLCKRHNRKKAVSPRERVYQPSEYDKATDLPRECPPDYSTVNAPYQQPSYRYEAYQRQPYYQTNDYEFAQTNQSAYETPIQQQYYEDVDNAPPLPPRPPNRG